MSELSNLSLNEPSEAISAPIDSVAGNLDTETAAPVSNYSPMTIDLKEGGNESELTTNHSLNIGEVSLTENEVIETSKSDDREPEKEEETNSKTMDLAEEVSKIELTSDEFSKNTEMSFTKKEFVDPAKTSEPAPIPQQNTTQLSNAPLVSNETSTFTQNIPSNFQETENDSFNEQPILNTTKIQSMAARRASFEQNSPKAVSPSKTTQFNNSNLAYNQPKPQVQQPPKPTQRSSFSEVPQASTPQSLFQKATENTTHTIDLDEKESFVNLLNEELGSDKDVSYRLPIDPTSMDIFTQVKDGVLLAKFVNTCCPGTIDERVLNLGKKLSTFQMVENLNCVINSCKAIGCPVVNIGAQDLMSEKEHLILGLIWQIVRAGLSQKVDIRFHPELIRLLESGETLEQFNKLQAEQILLRWFNYHLKWAGWQRTVTNFSSDVRDGKNYTVLLNQLSPSCSMAPLQTVDQLTRAEMVLQNADLLHCRKYLTAKTMLSGSSKLNLAFVANLFNKCPGLDPLSELEKSAIDNWLFGSEGDREARAFSLWLNSLGVEPFVHNLYDCIADGTILLQAIQHIRPDLVNPARINQATQSRFKMVENTNYLIEIGKEMNFTLIGIQGSDITDGVKILVLGYVWQLMREHIIQTLKTLGKKGKDVTEADIIEWANSIVKKQGKKSVISSFKDGSLRSGIFFLDILDSMRPGVVDYNAVQREESVDAYKMNAKYAISIARKLGASIFLLPEDIVEVKPKMILTFVGTLMAIDNGV